MALIFSALQIIFTLLTPVFIGQAVDHIVGKGLVDFDMLLNKLMFARGCGCMAGRICDGICDE